MKKWAAQVKAESKQLKFLTRKTIFMLEYAQALIGEADEHTIIASEQIKANAAE